MKTFPTYDELKEVIRAKSERCNMKLTPMDISVIALGIQKLYEESEG